MQRKKIKKTIIFDNTCNLCNNTVQWIHSNPKEPNITFCFLPFTSNESQFFLRKNHLRTDYLESVIVIENNLIYYTQSEAFFQITQHLTNWKYTTKILRLIPSSFRNRLYNIAARNRTKWFGSVNNTKCSIS